MSDDSYFHVRRWLAYAWLAAMLTFIVWYIPDAARKTRNAVRAKQLTVVLQQLEQAIVLVDSQMRVELFSVAAEKMFGVSESVVLGKPITWMIPVEDRKSHAIAVSQFWQAPDTIPRTFECQAKTFTGETIDVQVTLHGCRSDDGDWRLVAIIERQEKAKSVIKLPTPSQKSAIGNNPAAIGPGARQRL